VIEAPKVAQLKRRSEKPHHVVRKMVGQRHCLTARVTVSEFTEQT
jgi:hypothetical protein